MKMNQHLVDDDLDKQIIKGVVGWMCSSFFRQLHNSREIDEGKWKAK